MSLLLVLPAAVQAQITITTTSPVPAGTVGSVYYQTLTAVGGRMPYTWVLYAGGLPSGIAMSTNGVIFGTPNVGMTANFSVSVTDTNAATSTKDFSLEILTIPIPLQLGDYIYTTNTGTVTILGYTGPGGAVTIPDTINGLPVASIGDNAFEGSSLTSVTIPDSVTSGVLVR
jgi:hypothetical protein